ncbi:MAG: hypothetical protein ACI8UP_003163 [Porticoccaceae bacterium]|jgi:hypothetical protein
MGTIRKVASKRSGIRWRAEDHPRAVITQKGTESGCALEMVEGVPMEFTGG